MNDPFETAFAEHQAGRYADAARGYSALLDHQSNLAAGEHEHWFLTCADWAASGW